VWERVGGFDPSLPAYEDHDFWLAAIDLGFEGEILDEALVRHRVQRGSRYHQGISSGVYMRSKAATLQKHRASLAGHGEDVFAALLDFQRTLHGHGQTLAAQRTQLEQELGNVGREWKEVAHALTELGEEPFAWGELRQRTAASDLVHSSETIYDHYVRHFLAANADVTARRVLRIGAGDVPPATAREYNGIIAIDVLLPAADIDVALSRCRDSLRPGGVLLATFRSVPTNENRMTWGFTEASVRALFSKAFSPEATHVTTYGNLMACVAYLCGLAPDSLDPGDLDHHDPSFPLLVAARVEIASDTQVRRSSQERGGRRRPQSSLSQGRGAVLAYHRIARLTPDTHRLCTPPEVFRAHMDLLRARYRTVALNDLASAVLDRSMPERAIAVTFDDGCADNLLIASSILCDLEIPATFFIHTEAWDNEREAWWDTAERILISKHDVPERLRIRAGSARLDLPTTTPEERRSALFALHGVLLEKDFETRDSLLFALLEWSGRALDVRATHRLLTRGEVARLSERPGHEIGAHTIHHLMLPAYPSEVRRRELAENRSQLEDATGKPVRAVAYPYGAVDFHTAEISHQVGFDSGWTIDDDVVTADGDPLRLPRLDASQQDLEGFEFMLEKRVEGRWTE
jgi:peptidoglycan/xylan/chitin deacetylase (PgdA/CDA1 family)